MIFLSSLLRYLRPSFLIVHNNVSENTHTVRFTLGQRRLGDLTVREVTSQPMSATSLNSQQKLERTADRAPRELAGSLPKLSACWLVLIIFSRTPWMNVLVVLLRLRPRTWSPQLY